ncbi:hypothetical protein BU25DRAFT_415384 [Macroventuria anomochaeta]|uniref:Uncharacterized protein n=1 Tax=Macroventuria anomochaeta TaxID=301207 RepID=A0ACB6RJZ6_9PLEO|nr:uncharacterized protein BU25DRAFT_415384 [Macroventuria anomochaeta]KAF2622226.1 hypothetical protein BU25DRAFT_415384 [Macroventuria anomochaeta]
MAILPSQPGIKISIVCNGAILQEYEDDDEEPNHAVVSKYIEAVSGAEFGIRWDVSSPWPPYTILFKYYLDQKKASDRYCRLENFKHPSYIYTEEGATSMVNGQGYLHRFAFAALTVDDAGAPVPEQLMKDIKGMGEITVKAFFVAVQQTSSVVDRALDNNIREVGKIPEKALKGRSLSHQTSLRAPQAIAKFSTATCDYIDPARKSFATYTFKYRSRDALKSLLIIPRSPSPVPLEDRDVDTLSAAEMRELLRRQREREADARAIKQERGIKRELNCEQSSTYTDDTDDDEISIVSTKRRRENYLITVNENGVEEIDLT